MAIEYAREDNLSASDYIECLSKTTLGRVRPISDPGRVQSILDNSSLVVTAREGGRILGLCRCLTDWHWVCYCADMAVVDEQQGGGIGQAMLLRVEQILGPRVGIALLSLPGAEGFYRRIGMEEPAGFWRDRSE